MLNTEARLMRVLGASLTTSWKALGRAAGMKGYTARCAALRLEAKGYLLLEAASTLGCKAQVTIMLTNQKHE